MAANAASNAPTGLNRFRSDGVTAIAVGGSTPETTVVFKGTVSDPDTGQQVKLQIELRPLATAFTGTFTNESSLVTNGDVAQITVPNLSSGTPYHWRARTVESNGAASAWVSFGGNRDNATDFMVASGP